MVYKITFKIDTDEIDELLEIFHRYDIDYEINEKYEEVE